MLQDCSQNDERSILFDDSATGDLHDQVMPYEGGTSLQIYLRGAIPWQSDSEQSPAVNTPMQHETCMTDH